MGYIKNVCKMTGCVFDHWCSIPGKDFFFSEQVVFQDVTS